jgi:hypothetical protein
MTYFMNKSHTDPNDIVVLPPRSSKLILLKFDIACLSSCSNCIHVAALEFLIIKVKEFIAAIGTATSR